MLYNLVARIMKTQRQILESVWRLEKQSSQITKEFLLLRNPLTERELAPVLSQFIFLSTGGIKGVSHHLPTFFFLAICMPSLDKYTLKSFVFFKVGSLLFHCWIVEAPYIFWMLILDQMYDANVFYTIWYIALCVWWWDVWERFEMRVSPIADPGLELAM